MDRYAGGEEGGVGIWDGGLVGEEVLEWEDEGFGGVERLLVEAFLMC